MVQFGLLLKLALWRGVVANAHDGESVSSLDETALLQMTRKQFVFATEYNKKKCNKCKKDCRKDAEAASNDPDFKCKGKCKKDCNKDCNKTPVCQENDESDPAYDACVTCCRDDQGGSQCGNKCRNGRDCCATQDCGPLPPPPPTCEEKGHDLINRGSPDSYPDLEFVDTGAGSFTSAGKLISVNFFAAEAGNQGLRFRIYRPKPDGEEGFIFIGQTEEIEVPTAGLVQEHIFSEQVPFEAGDNIGWSHTGTGNIPYDYAQGPVAWNIGITASVGANVPFSFNSDRWGGRRYSYRVAIAPSSEPDCVPAPAPEAELPREPAACEEKGNGVEWRNKGPDTFAGIEFVDRGAGAFESSGRLRSVKFYAGSVGDSSDNFRFRIYRPDGNGFKCVEETEPLVAPTKDVVQEHIFSEHVPFQAGDFIGWAHTGTGIIPYSKTFSKDPNTVSYSYPVKDKNENIPFTANDGRRYSYRIAIAPLDGPDAECEPEPEPEQVTPAPDQSPCVMEADGVECCNYDEARPELTQYTPCQSDWTRFNSEPPEGHDPSSFEWAQESVNAEWDGTPYQWCDPQLAGKICLDGGYVIRGLGQMFNEKNAEQTIFVDPHRPTRAEVDEWHRLAVNHLRDLLGFGPERHVQKSHCLSLEALWGNQRRESTMWDAKYNSKTHPRVYAINGYTDWGGEGTSPKGPCHNEAGESIGSKHCGHGFIPDQEDQAPYLPPGHLPCPSGGVSQASGSASGSKYELPWTMKWSKVFCTYLQSEGPTGHTGPFLRREKFGFDFFDDGDDQPAFLGKWGGQEWEFPDCNL